ncbi:hypothetical protein [Microvirga brassicacearum]|uniref:Uncharacterized protein n=1 Tax=Microvirga brassicacearum TaxID=2580413 RepID=A0A5N3PH85_9HYPH|nr:hypothetical protein [Microvirga brassicacearum]KAB0269074.1 hypothetical protein FEZ63_02905 [Microvirga brassicacearum]
MAKTYLAQLKLSLQDDLSAGAKKAAGAINQVEKAIDGLSSHGVKGARGLNVLDTTLKAATKNAQAFAKEAGKTIRWGSGFQSQVDRLRLTSGEFDKLRHSWRALQSEIKTGDASFKTQAIRRWRNDSIASITAVRAAQHALTEDGIREAKQRAAAEKRAAAESAKEQLRLAREVAKEKARLAKEATRADRQAAQETAKVARDAAREQARVSRETAREAIRAQRELDRAQREHGRGAGAIGRSVVRNAAFALGAGSGTYLAGRAFRATARAGGESKREDARDYLAGLPPGDTARLRAASMAESTQYPSIRATDMHSVLRETATTALGTEGALSISPELAKALTIIQSSKGADEAVSQLAGFMRGLDTLGKNVDVSLVTRLLDGMARAAGVQGMEYKPRDMFTFAKRAKSAGGALGTDFLNTVLPSLIADMGPDRVGTALATATSSLIGGTSMAGPNKKRGQRQQALGLRDAQGNFLNRDQLATAPHLYAWNTLKPALEKSGVDITNDSAVSEAMNKLFPQMVADVFTKLIQQEDQYKITQGYLARAPGTAAAGELGSRDPFVSAKGVVSALDNLMAALTSPLMDPAMAMMNNLAGALNAMATAAASNPAVAAAIGVGTIATGAGAGLLGWKAMQWGTQSLIGGAVAGGGAAASTVAVAEVAAPAAAAAAVGILPTIARLAGPLGMGGTLLYGAGSALAESGQKYGGMTGQERLTATGGGTMQSMTAAIAEDARQRAIAAGYEIPEGIAEGINANSGQVDAASQSIMERIRSFFSAGVNVPVRPQLGGGAVSPVANPAGRANGGNVYPGGLYQINEHDKEFFQPAERGRILNGRQLRGGDGAGGGGPVSLSISPTFHINGNTDPDAIASIVMARIESETKQLLRGMFSDYGSEIA